MKHVLLRGHQIIALGLVKEGHEKLLYKAASKRGKEYTNATIAILKDLVEHPRKRVVLTDTYGTLCEGCNDRATCDERGVAGYDREIMQRYDFKKGKAYTASQVFKRITGDTTDIQAEVDRLKKLVHTK
jgi:hypothetical protein